MYNVWNTPSQCLNSPLTKYNTMSKTLALFQPHPFKNNNWNPHVPDYNELRDNIKTTTKLPD